MRCMWGKKLGLPVRRLDCAVPEFKGSRYESGIRAIAIVRGILGAQPALRCAWYRSGSEETWAERSRTCVPPVADPARIAGAAIGFEGECIII